MFRLISEISPKLVKGLADRKKRLEKSSATCDLRYQLQEGRDERALRYGRSLKFVTV